MLSVQNLLCFRNYHTHTPLTFRDPVNIISVHNSAEKHQYAITWTCSAATNSVSCMVVDTANHALN